MKLSDHPLGIAVMDGLSRVARARPRGDGCWSCRLQNGSWLDRRAGRNRVLTVPTRHEALRILRAVANTGLLR